MPALLLSLVLLLTKEIGWMDARIGEFGIEQWEEVGFVVSVVGVASKASPPWVRDQFLLLSPSIIG
jgi:hypothetical protein